MQKREEYHLESVTATWRKKLEILEMSIRQSNRMKRRAKHELSLRAQTS